MGIREKSDIIIRNVPKELKDRFERDFHLWIASVIENEESSLSVISFYNKKRIKKSDFVSYLLDIFERYHLGH